MPFNSYPFVFAFLPVAVAGFWLLVRLIGRDWAIFWLVLSSIVFYAYAGWFGLLVLVPSILLDYLIAHLLLRLPPARARLRMILFAIGVATNVAFLAYFKYRNFFLGTVNSLFDTHFPLTALVLPLGISFLTFQKIAFLADAHASAITKPRFLHYLFFTTFFPRTLAGPIIRYTELVTELEKLSAAEITNHLAAGVALFSIGFFKKAFVADQLAVFVTSVFDLGPLTMTDPGTPTLLTSWAAVLAYTFELYFDFSGYSDMALGAARMCGIRLPMNFNSPFKASSIIEFWSRWHITLTRFLTAYIYTPLVLKISRARLLKGVPVLAGSRTHVSAFMSVAAVPTLFTMAISGVWHGVGWQFLVWGLLHGIYLTINQAWRLFRQRFWRGSHSYSRVMKPVGTALTFIAVVVALVFFRARSVSDALAVFYAMVGGNGVVPDDLQVLRQAGVAVPSNIVHLFLPFTPWIWFAILLPWVMLLPNSLELLQAYRPAIDYPEPRERPSSTPKVTTYSSRTAGGWFAAMHGEEPTGIPLGLLAASIAATMCLLGILMLYRGESFIYLNF